MDALRKLAPETVYASMTMNPTPAHAQASADATDLVRRGYAEFVGGRKLGRVLQFFLNFGNSTDTNGAVVMASEVFRQGVGGMWLSLQTLFITPFFWFTQPWYGRSRVITMADLLSNYAGQNADLRRWSEGAEINRDIDLRLQYLGGWGINSTMEDAIYRQLLTYRRMPPAIFTGSPERVGALVQAIAATAR